MKSAAAAMQNVEWGYEASADAILPVMMMQSFEEAAIKAGSAACGPCAAAGAAGAVPEGVQPPQSAATGAPGARVEASAAPPGPHAPAPHEGDVRAQAPGFLKLF